MVSWWLSLLACSGPSDDGPADGRPTDSVSETAETGTPGDDDDDDTTPTGDTAPPFEVPTEASWADLVCPDADLVMSVDITATQSGGPSWADSFPLTTASCQPGVLTGPQLALGRGLQESSCAAAGLAPQFCTDFASDVSDWLDTYNGLPGVLQFDLFIEGPWALDDIPEGAVAGVGYDAKFHLFIEGGTEWWVTSPTAWGQRYNYVSPAGLITSQGSRHFDELKFTPVPATLASCTFQTDNLIDGQILSASRVDIVYNRPTQLDCTWTDGPTTVDVEALITYAAHLYDDTE